MIGGWKENKFKEEPGLVPILPIRIAEEHTWESETEHSLFLIK